MKKHILYVCNPKITVYCMPSQHKLFDMRVNSKIRLFFSHIFRVEKIGCPSKKCTLQAIIGGVTLRPLTVSCSF